MRIQLPFPWKPSVEESLDRIGLEFQAEFFRRACASRPENFAALSELAHVLTRLGRFEEGLEIDRRLVQLEPNNPTVHYNLACSLALMADASGAMDALEAAVELGYDDPEHLLSDEDLTDLHAEARFMELVRRLEGLKE